MPPETFLYHVTKESNVADIRDHGLLPGKTGPLRVPGLTDRDRRKARTKLGKTRTVDQIVERFRPPEQPLAQIPDRTESLFFWTTLSRAEDYATSNQAVLAVDPTDLDGGGFGNGAYLQAISNAVFTSLFTDPLHPELIRETEDGTELDSDTEVHPFIRERAEAFWETVTGYDQQVVPGMEAWFNTEIPPDVIIEPEPTEETTLQGGQLDIEDVSSLNLIEDESRDVFQEAAYGCYESATVDRVYVSGGVGNGIARRGSTPLSLVLELGGADTQSGSRLREDLNRTERQLELLNHRVIRHHREWFPHATIELADTNAVAAEYLITKMDLRSPEVTTAYDLTTGQRLHLSDLAPVVKEDAFAQIVFEQLGDEEETIEYIDRYHE